MTTIRQEAATAPSAARYTLTYPEGRIDQIVALTNEIDRLRQRLADEYTAVAELRHDNEHLHDQLDATRTQRNADRDVYWAREGWMQMNICQLRTQSLWGHLKTWWRYGV